MMFEIIAGSDGTYNIAILIGQRSFTIAYGYQSIATATDEIIAVISKLFDSN